MFIPLINNVWFPPGNGGSRMCYHRCPIVNTAIWSFSLLLTSGLLATLTVMLVCVLVKLPPIYTFLEERQIVPTNP